MTDAQIFQLIGIMYLVVGIGILTSREFYDKVINGFFESAPMHYLGGLLALLVGFLIISFHNIWIADWSVIITIIGWIAFIKGVALLAWPMHMLEFSKRFIGMKNIITIWGLVAMILGILCCILGFFILPKPPT